MIQWLENLSLFKSIFEFAKKVVSAPTGFRHLRSAADILKEFDPDFAAKQKRPAAVPVSQAQAMRKNPGSPTPTSPTVLSPRSPTVSSPPSPELTSAAVWRQQGPKFEPINDTVFCCVVSAFAAEREGDLACETQDFLACNVGQDFSEDFWFGAKTDGTIGYFPQANVRWVKSVE